MLTETCSNFISECIHKKKQLQTCIFAAQKMCTSLFENIIISMVIIIIVITISASTALKVRFSAALMLAF